ncbi:MAG TPA: methyltransferase domain-containing protein, partial [Gaiellaceae bacterium]|nr:methyltransferase domain-containing protein [Gaiellaceae bacterium]
MATAATRVGTPAAKDAGALEAAYADLASFFDDFAAVEQQWRRRNRTYHRLLQQIARLHIPPGARVLEIGAGSGDLLASLEPSHGVGVDVSPKMVELARSRHPDLRFEVGAGEALDLGETFDYVVLSDVAPFVQDFLALFEAVARHSHPGTRVVISLYSNAWRPLIRLAETLRLKPRKPIRNWVSTHDVTNLLRLAGFDVVTRTSRILLPKQIPLVTLLLNGVVANVWPFTHLCLTAWIIARPQATPLGERSVSVVCPCRNEEGHVAPLVRRLPEMGTATELVFVEGGSTDDTRGEIERQIAAHPTRDISLIAQPGKGKGDAVRAGFAAA